MTRRPLPIVLFALLAFALAVADDARADGPAETTTLFADGITALQHERPGDAIADFEALADRGVVDPIASFDRGLAYAERWRGGKGIPGDLGRAAQGFEEARALAGSDAALIKDASGALALVREEIARRRALAGDPVDVDPGVPLGRAVVELASEDAWNRLAFAASLVLTAALFVRWRATARRVRIGGAIAIGAASPVLALAALLGLAARDARLHLREAILVAESAHLADDHHIVVPGASPLPEAARVTIEDTSGGWARIHFGSALGWLPSSSVRAITRAE